MTTYVGPCKLECLEACDVPEGVEMALVPVPRHAWSDVVVCPNEGCDRAFLVTQRPAHIECSPDAGTMEP